MKKQHLPKLCYGFSILFAAGFFIRVVMDWLRYDSALHSAPFWAWLLTAGICFLLPALILLVIGSLLQRKFSGK